MTSMYDKLAEKNPERKVVGEEKGEKEEKTLAEKEENYDDMSDLQTSLAKLFPGTLGNEITNKLMVARISPDVFMDLLYLMTESDVFNTPSGEIIDVARFVIKNYTLGSIGLDGKGRIDQIELAGASKADEELGGGLGKGAFGG